MYISIDWLREHLDLKSIKLGEFQKQLLLNGFEIEEIITEQNTNDIILDISTTSNRPDVLSFIGFINELQTLLKLKVIKKKRKIKSKFIFLNNNSFKINFSETLFYLGFSISLNKIPQKTPNWLDFRLKKANLEEIGFLENLTNYMMLEYGQPVQIYDYNKILNVISDPTKMKISTRFAVNGEKFIGINNKTYLLNPLTLLVILNNQVISIAGGPISKEFAPDKNTCFLFIEFGIFSPGVLRKSLKSIGFRNSATLYYERQINTFLVNSTVKRFLSLLLTLSNNSLELEMLVNYCNPVTLKFFEYNLVIKSNKILVKPPKIKLSFKRLALILGLQNKFELYSSQFIPEKISQLGFKICNVKVENKAALLILDHYKHSILIPFNRYPDISSEIDLIEEIGRIIGFNNFPSILPKIHKIGKLSKYEKFKRTFRTSFINLGFNESINYSFINENDFKWLTIQNNEQNLKFTLLNKLLQTNYNNLKNNSGLIQTFEIGRIFIKLDQKKFLEYEVISGIFGDLKCRYDWQNLPINFDWFQAKGYLETIFKKLNLDLNYVIPPECPSICHSGRIFYIQAENKTIGVFFQINPKVEKKYKRNIFVFELNFSKLIQIFRLNKITYSNYSLYPPISIDLSLLVPNEVTFIEISKLIIATTDILLKSFEVFDIYENALDKTNYSLGIKLTFQSFNRTLLKSEIELLVNEIESKLFLEQNIKIRK